MAKNFDEELTQRAIEAARSAGKVLMENFGNVRKVDYKGDVNLVTDADRLSEEIIVDLIGREYPDHSILAEEGDDKETKSDYRWIVDPLDGTTNYAHGFPCFCISIALEHRGEIVLGIIYNPILDELFTARKGTGAWLNGKKVTVSSTSELSKSLLATGFPYDIRKSKENNLDHFATFALRSQAIRRAGSAALDLCYVASGRFDGFWELKLSPWDMAAGCLIVGEAGGSVTDFAGGEFTIFGEEILASNGRIHREMMDVLGLSR